MSQTAPLTQDRILGGQLTLTQTADGYRAGLDAMLLAAAVTLKPGAHAAEFGCGPGAALLSVTEGEDKPLKYPGLFNTADVAAITKLDLAEACEFDGDLARANIDAVRPGMRVFETSAKRGTGLDDWLDYLAERRAMLTAG